MRGVSFGSFLIKQVVRELLQELPLLNRFVTLSPEPGFVRWLRFNSDEGLGVANRRASALKIIDQPNWINDDENNTAAKKLLMPLVVHYLITVQHKI